MKVALLSSSFSPRNIGGTETYLERLVHQLNSRVELVVVTGPLLAPTAHPRGLESAKIREVSIGKPYPIWDWVNHHLITRIVWHVLDFHDSISEQQIREVLREEDPDVVHTHNVRGLSMSALALPLELGIPHVHTLHDFLLLSPLSNLLIGRMTVRPSGSFNRSYQRAMRRLTSGVRDLIGPSEYILDQHVQRGFFIQSRRHLLRMPLLTEAPKMADSPRIETPGQVSPRPAFLFVGVLEASKGVPVLLKSIAQLAEIQATFRIVGDGRLRERVRQAAIADPRIRFLGHVSNEELFSLFENSDFLILPSLWPENAPMVISEALSFGLGIIASDVGGLSELVGDGGLLVKPGSPDELSRAIRFATR